MTFSEATGLFTSVRPQLADWSLPGESFWGFLCLQLSLPGLNFNPGLR